MTAGDNGLQAIRARHPEWQPWLAVIEQALAASLDAAWDNFVPGLPARRVTSAPLLAGTQVRIERALLWRFLQRLFGACQSGTEMMATVTAARRAEPRACAWFHASLCAEHDRLNAEAELLGIEPQAFQSVAALFCIPFLQACNRRWSALVAANWTEGYCPICGAWPALTEVRGIERSRYFRCGRCGSGWYARNLFCPYCGTSDHEELVSLVPQTGGTDGVVEACKHCLGYMKVFTTLQGSAPGKIILDDLASVALDIAALEQGYRRPPGIGHAVDVTLTEDPGRRVFFT